MTKARMAQAVANRETLYYIDWATSKNFQKAYRVPPVSNTDGPYLRLTTAKRKAAEMRKTRTQYTTRDGMFHDDGPTYKYVRLRGGEPA